MTCKENVLSIIQEEYLNCMEEMSSVENTNPNFYVIAQKISFLQAFRKRIETEIN
jgi:hypothetical protein